MAGLIKRLCLALLAGWTVLWVLVALLLLQDNPPSVKPGAFTNLALVAFAPWAVTLAVLLGMGAYRIVKTQRAVSETRLGVLPPVRVKANKGSLDSRKAG